MPQQKTTRFKKRTDGAFGDVRRLHRAGFEDSDAARLDDDLLSDVADQLDDYGRDSVLDRLRYND